MKTCFVIKTVSLISMAWTSRCSYDICNADRYDYLKSTEENYGSEGNLSGYKIGKYYKIRQLLDYNYHRTYSPFRQHLQDDIVDRLMPCTIVREKNNKTCEAPINFNWIGFFRPFVIFRFFSSFLNIILLCYL